MVASLTVTPERRREFAFTVPLRLVREQVVTRKADPSPPRAITDLAGRKLAVRPSSSYRRTLDKLREQLPELVVVDVDESIDTEQILCRVADGELDLTVADSHLVESTLRYRPELKVAIDLTEDQPNAWALHRKAPKLQKALNDFLKQTGLLADREEVYLADLPELKKRKVLRVLTRNNASTYFLHRGELVGFEYDLVRHFAKLHGLRVEIVVPPAREDLLPWLLAGRGDLVAASLTINEQRKAAGVAFTRPNFLTRETVVCKSTEKPMEKPAQLTGRTVAVRPSSSYFQTLKNLQAKGIQVQIKNAPEELETESLIAKVGDGSYDLTMADGHILDIERTYRDDVQSCLTLDRPVELAWAVHPENRELLADLNAFWKKEYRGLVYNMLVKRYFKSPRSMSKKSKARASRTGKLSPYDDIVKKYAKKYGFDWKLIVSQMYSESRFDPKAKSWVGACGLLQVMPRTGKELGLTDLENPQVGIQAGVKYMNWLRDRFSEDLNPHTRNWLTLAAYNVGLGHVKDAQALAKEKGLNPNRFFDHVEKALPMLAQPQNAKRARHGYCRGTEPVAYVRAIRERWRAYRRALDKP